MFLEDILSPYKIFSVSYGKYNYNMRKQKVTNLGQAIDEDNRNNSKSN